MSKPRKSFDIRPMSPTKTWHKALKRAGIDFRRNGRPSALSDCVLGPGVRIAVFGQQTFGLAMLNFKDHRPQRPLWPTTGL